MLFFNPAGFLWEGHLTSGTAAAITKIILWGLSLTWSDYGKVGELNKNQKCVCELQITPFDCLVGRQ